MLTQLLSYQTFHGVLKPLIVVLTIYDHEET